MDALTKAQIIQILRDAEEFEIYFERVEGSQVYQSTKNTCNGWYYRIVFDLYNTDLIAYVVVDRDECELAFEEWKGATNPDWRKDKAFLKDQFWANLDWLNVIEP